MTNQTLSPPITTATEATVEEISSRNGEPDWLRERRVDAWRAYEAMDLPEEKDEEWRRTDVRAIPFDRVEAPLPQDRVDWTLSYDPRDAIGSQSAGHVALIDGSVAFRGHGDAIAASGVIVTDLRTAAREHEALLRKHLGTVVRLDEWKYLTLHSALWSGGSFIFVPDNAELELPLHLVQSLDKATSLYPRTLVVTGRNSRVAVIDESYSADSGEPAFVSGAVEIVVGDGAKLDYYNVNRWGAGVYNFNTVRAIVGRDAEFTGVVAGIGSRLTKMRLDAEMPSSGGRTQLLGVTFGNGEQHFDYNTLQNHVGDHTISDLQFKSALTDSASLVWYGITRIKPPASGSEANQTSRNLLLSEHAKASPIPILEIEAWDVAKCSHGATAGPVEESELFYLQARGIARADAERMLVEGFFADVVDRIPNAAVRTQIMDAVFEKIGGEGERLTFEELRSA